MTTPPPLLEPVELEVRPAVAEALPLPEARKPDEHGMGWFTAGQMRAYAADAVAAERERCAKVCVVPLNIAVENDAERYQWIRNSDWDCFDSRWLSAHDAYGAGPDELDALIDAKMAENKAVG